MATNQTRSLLPQAQVVVFTWNKDAISDDVAWADLAKSNPLDISAEVEEITFDKDLSGAAGSFSITLPPTTDWESLGVTPGTWCLIYLTNNGDLSVPSASAGGGNRGVKPEDLLRQGDRLRCIGFIDRVGITTEMEPNGSMETSVQLTGRDFGVIYEEAQIFLNMFYFDKSLLDSLAAHFKARSTPKDLSVTRLMETLHSIMFCPQEFGTVLNDPKTQDRKTLSTLGYQWLLPQEMVQAIGLKLKPGKSLPFWGNLDETTWFWESPASFPIENPLSIIGSGSCWEKLKAFSLEPLHQLFTEVDEDGKPSLTFRPIPWRLNSAGYPKSAQYIDSMIDVFQEGNSLTLNAVDFFDLNVGRDIHNLYSFFMTTTQQADYAATDNISDLQNPSRAGRQFPFSAVNATARFGFRPMLVELNTMAQLSLNLDGRSDQGGLLELNEIIYDFWRPSFFMDSGVATIVGNPAIKCGRVLKFGDDLPYRASFLFFVEGYSDHYSISGDGTSEWTTTLKLSRGAPFDAYMRALGPGADPSVELSSKLGKFFKRASYTPKE